MCISPPDGLPMGLSEWQGGGKYIQEEKCCSCFPTGVKEQLQAGKAPTTTGLTAAGMHKERHTGCPV